MIMKEFYLEYKGDELMQQLVAQVPKNILIISMLMIRNGNKLLPNGKILYEAINKEVVMKEIGDRYTNNTFENIKHIDEYGNEYWYARELSKVLEYKDWRNFLKVLNKAKDACKNSGFNIDEQLVEVNRLSKRKKLRYREDILDNMNEDELVANLFRINQTKQKLLKDNVLGEKEAKDVHYEVGEKVRKAIADIGGMMPEEMPTPKKSLKELERERKKLEIKEQKKLDEIK